ncbi:unnamed protein product [Bursaphelenchus xylophilus]|uniref:(pine wood nematode) hypothetical protein n=1 Tax=Bursaphelenchus xylophilus TaxID=6326 RepID=A0A1I7RLB8_BURXY|nr:unnamed protein product [Bursaphelenchus xylophilus]CAG9083187.1 unnamed protein product [Bursaphelenchus xylophilus]
MSRNNRGRGGGGDGKKLSYKEKSSITYVQNNDPPFLRKIKEKFGYQETKLEDKFFDEGGEDAEESPGFSGDPDDIRNLKKEDRPQIVVLNPEKDVSEGELDEEVKKKREAEDKEKIEKGLITFKKPVKRTAPESEDKSNEKKKKQETQQHIQQSRLLSFGDEEGD